MQTDQRVVGRVIRVGRGWADVTVGRSVRRITTRPDLLIRVGTIIRLEGDEAVVIQPRQTASTGRAR